MTENETRIVDVDGDELLVTWGWKGGMDGVAMIQTRAAHGEVVLDLSGIAKLREALDRAEAAWHDRIGGVEKTYQYSNPPMCGPSSHDIAIQSPPIYVSIRAEAEVLPPSNCMILDKDKIESIKAELRHLVFASKWGAAEPWPEIRDTRPLPKLGGLKSLAPRYPQLTDWVHAQPEGAVLLAVIHGSERAQPVAEDWILRRKLFICNRCDLANAFVAGVKFDAVWLSREVAPDCESRIPQGVSVYREGT